MREIQLILIGVEGGEKVEDLVKRAVGLGVGLVDLVEHHDGPQPQRQGLGGDEFRLRHRPFGGIHQQHHTIDHRQDTLDLATEIGVAGGVDDVDPRAFPLHRCGLGKNRDAALAFQIIAVHGAFGHGLVVPESTGLLEKIVHERCLAVVDMRDNRNIAEVHGEPFWGIFRVGRAVTGSGPVWLGRNAINLRSV